MKSLEEKFKPYIYYNDTNRSVDIAEEIKDNAKHCTEIAESFALGFANWIRDEQMVYYEYRKDPVWVLDYTTEDLLEQYKQHLKENGK